jgi:hypothetical protein
MKNDQNGHRAIVVALIFGAIIAISLLFLYLSGDHQSPQQACDAQCAPMNKQGHLVYRGPDTPKSAYKVANSVCECE